MIFLHYLLTVLQVQSITTHSKPLQAEILFRERAFLASALWEYILIPEHVYYLAYCNI